jgi:hypothetical protein
MNRSQRPVDNTSSVSGRLTAERSEADKPAKAHKTIFAPNNIYYFFFKPS